MARSILFVVTFYFVTALFLVVGIPLLLAPRRIAMLGLKAHAHAVVALQRIIVGTRLEVRGRDNLPDGAALIAAKHLSAWDTIGLIPLFRDPALVLKAELLRIPVYGWFIRKFEMIPIERKRGPSALRTMFGHARDRLAEGRDLLIFPEGTRQPLDAPFEAKSGIVLLYEKTGAPCVPVALNSGVFWPRRGWRHRPGTLVVEILEPIPAGLERKAFLAELTTRIDGATRRLIAEAERADTRA